MVKETWREGTHLKNRDSTTGESMVRVLVYFGVSRLVSSLFSSAAVNPPAPASLFSPTCVCVCACARTHVWTLRTSR